MVCTLEQPAVTEIVRVQSSVSLPTLAITSPQTVLFGWRLAKAWLRRDVTRGSRARWHMGWRNSASVPWLHGERRPHLGVPLAGFVVFVVGMCAIVSACVHQLPGAPDDIPQLTISGYVYEQETSAFGEPKLANVLITVEQADRSPRTGRSDAVGFYTLSVRAGTISITASKAGYGTRASSFDMSISTVLNFSLAPHSEQLAEVRVMRLGPTRPSEP